MKYPVFLYDDLCTSCTGYAKLVDRYCNGKITMIGLYSDQCTKFAELVFPKDVELRYGSWFVDGEFAYGGRNGLLHLLKYILFTKKDSSTEFQTNIFKKEKCISDCSTVKGVLFRSFSILTM